MLVADKIRWQSMTYRLFESVLYREFECRKSKTAGCFGHDCHSVKIIEYHICRAHLEDIGQVLFAVKFYIKDDMPVVGLSHHIVVNGTHLFYPAIDWDKPQPPPVWLIQRAVFWWRYRSRHKKITAYHIVLRPPRETANMAIRVMMPYTDPMHWAVTVRRIAQGIYEDFAILRVFGLRERVLDYMVDPDDAMAVLNLRLRQLFWL